MIDKVVFLKERLGFIIDNIELFLEDYNVLTTKHPLPVSYSLNYFDFYTISSVNTFSWEKFGVDASSFNIATNDISNLIGITKGKTYVIPPFITKQRFKDFITKLTWYIYSLEQELNINNNSKYESILSELNQNIINLSIYIKGETHIYPFSQICRFIIEYREYKKLKDTNKSQIFTSKTNYEMMLLETIILDNLELV